jgi:hypothetical protein
VNVVPLVQMGLIGPQPPAAKRDKPGIERKVQDGANRDRLARLSCNRNRGLRNRDSIRNRGRYGSSLLVTVPGHPAGSGIELGVSAALERLAAVLAGQDGHACMVPGSALIVWGAAESSLAW